MYFNKTATSIFNSFVCTIVHKCLFLLIGDKGLIPTVEVTSNSKPCLQSPCKIFLGADSQMNVKFIARMYYKIFFNTYSSSDYMPV